MITLCPIQDKIHLLRRGGGFAWKVPPPRRLRHTSLAVSKAHNFLYFVNFLRITINLFSLFIFKTVKYNKIENKHFIRCDVHLQSKQKYQNVNRNTRLLSVSLSIESLAYAVKLFPTGRGWTVLFSLKATDADVDTLLYTLYFWRANVRINRIIFYRNGRRRVRNLCLVSQSNPGGQTKFYF